MTRISMCGIVRDDGRDCPNYVDPDSPLNLCQPHLDEAYRWVSREEGSSEGIMPEACQLCGNRDGREYSSGWLCARCGWKLGDIPTRVQIAAQRKSPGLEVVYYLRFDTRIKIGTTTNLPGRLVAIPHDEVLALERGGQKKEFQRHQQFAASRMYREWFHLTPELDAHIRVLRAGVEDPMAQWRFWVQRDAA